MDRVTNHVEKAKQRLIDDFRKPDSEASIAAFVEQLQKAEDALWEIHDGFRLDSAVGKQLDLIGAIVGRGRNGLDDNPYRAKIKAQIIINRSRGLTTDVVKVLVAVAVDTVTNTPLEIHYYEVADATIQVEVMGGTFDASSILDDLQSTKSGGVRLVLLYSSYPASELFTYSNTVNATEVSATMGWARNDFSTGGRWIGNKE